MSTRLKVSVSAFRYLLHNLCVSVRPFFLSISMSRTVLKSPPIIKVLSVLALRYFSNVLKCVKSSVFGPYMFKMTKSLSLIVISTA